MTMADKKEKQNDGFVSNESELKRYEDSKAHFMRREGTYADNEESGWNASKNCTETMKITTFVPKTGGQDEQWIEIFREYSEPRYEIQFVKQLDRTHYSAILKKIGTTDYKEIEYFAKGSKDTSFPSGKLKMAREVPDNGQ